MGGCSSREHDEEYVAHWKRDGTRFLAVGLTESDVKVFFEVFKHVSLVRVNASGSILLSDILNEIVPHEANNVFIYKAFAVFSDQSTDAVRLDFKQFVFGYWNLCSLSHKCLVRFGVDLYNTHQLVDISNEILKNCIGDIHNRVKDGINNAEYIVMESVKEKIDSFQDKPYHISDVLNFCHAFPTAIFPAYELQTHLQNHLLGQAAWGKLLQRREKANTYSNLKSLCELCQPSKSKSNAGPKSAGDVGHGKMSAKRASVVPTDSHTLLQDSHFVMPEVAGGSHHDSHHSTSHKRSTDSRSHKQHLLQESQSTGQVQSLSGHTHHDSHSHHTHHPVVVHVSSAAPNANSSKHQRAHTIAGDGHTIGDHDHKHQNSHSHDNGHSQNGHRSTSVGHHH